MHTVLCIDCSPYPYLYTIGSKGNPSNITISNIDSTSADVRWKVEVSISGHVVKSIDMRYMSKRKQQTCRPPRHLKTRCHVRRLSPTVCATLRWPRRSAPSCKVLQFKDCGAFCHENAVRLPNCGAFGKRCRNSVSGASDTNSEANHKSVAIKKRHTNVTNVAFFLTYTV